MQLKQDLVENASVKDLGKVLYISQKIEFLRENFIGSLLSIILFGSKIKTKFFVVTGSIKQNLKSEIIVRFYDYFFII